MEQVIEVVGFKAFKGFVQGEGINSGTLYSRVKMDARYNKPGENVKGGETTEEWKMPDADTVFRLQHHPLPFAVILEIERVSNGKETKEVVLSARAVEPVLSNRPVGKPVTEQQPAAAAAKV